MNRGPAVLIAVPLAVIVLWLVVPPADDGRSDFARQLFGEATASAVVVLFAMTLLLGTRARFLEPYFGGLDKMYRAHRQIGQTGMALLIVHVALTPWRLTPGGGVPAGLIAFAGLLLLIALTIGPRLPVLDRVFGISYRTWRHTHKFIGIFFIFSAAHMALVKPLAATSRLIFVVLIAAYVVGIASYLYTLLIARFVRPTYKYDVDEVRPLNDATVEIALAPRRKKALAFTSGQFVFVKFRGRGLREPHPFTVSSAPAEGLLRLTIKSSGDFTRKLRERIEPGRRATVEGSYGMLDYRQGPTEQIWIGGGIGVTPFLSWLRDLDDGLGRDVDFFYTVRERNDALFWDEICAVAQHHDRLRVHLNISADDGRLTSGAVATAVPGGLRGKGIYMCGPVPMINSLQHGFRHMEVSKADVHFEEFSFR